MSYLKSTKAVDETAAKEKDHNNIRKIIIMLESVGEYDMIKELGEAVRYYGKLLSYMGFDTKGGKWNSHLFPITKSDSQMDGIKSDIESYNSALKEYNGYAERLARDYGIDINFHTHNGHAVVFRPPPPVSSQAL